MSVWLPARTHAETSSRKPVTRTKRFNGIESGLFEGQTILVKSAIDETSPIRLRIERANQTVESLSQVLGIHPQKLTEELEFMQRTGLIKYVKGRYTVGPKMIHLGSDSNAIMKHHTNIQKAKEEVACVYKFDFYRLA